MSIKKKLNCIYERNLKDWKKNDLSFTRFHYWAEFQASLVSISKLISKWSQRTFDFDERWWFIKRVKDLIIIRKLTIEMCFLKSFLTDTPPVCMILNQKIDTTKKKYTRIMFYGLCITNSSLILEPFTKHYHIISIHVYIWSFNFQKNYRDERDFNDYFSWVGKMFAKEDVK